MRWDEKEEGNKSRYIQSRKDRRGVICMGIFRTGRIRQGQYVWVYSEQEGYDRGNMYGYVQRRKDRRGVICIGMFRAGRIGEG